MKYYYSLNFYINYPSQNSKVFWSMLLSIFYTLFGCVVFFAIISQNAGLSEELCDTKYVPPFSLRHLS